MSSASLPIAMPLTCEPLITHPLSHVIKGFPHLSGLELAYAGDESDRYVLIV